jgi:hypothetical protein
MSTTPQTLDIKFRQETSSVFGAQIARRWTALAGGASADSIATLVLHFLDTHTQCNMSVVIVGAGLGGLACGIACRQQGLDRPDT